MIDSKELQIGDWVSNPVVNEIGKIEGIYFDKELYSLVATDGHFPQKRFNPIPLTEDILKSNGFFQHLPNSNFWMYGEHLANEEGEDECIIYVRLHNDSYFVEITNNYNDDAMYERTLHFVHELQHALRLCGLCELADNFKVE